jgi:hypothetical protein
LVPSQFNCSSPSGFGLKLFHEDDKNSDSSISPSLIPTEEDRLRVYEDKTWRENFGHKRKE